MFDIIIRNGTIATASDVFVADIGLRDGVIAQIGGEMTEARQTIDATGKYVLPGGVDSHAVMTVARMNVAPLEERKAFTTALALEADGKTDGPVNAMIHMGTDIFTAEEIERFAKGGFFFTNAEMSLPIVVICAFTRDRDANTGAAVKSVDCRYRKQERGATGAVRKRAGAARGGQRHGSGADPAGYPGGLGQYLPRPRGAYGRRERGRRSAGPHRCSVPPPRDRVRGRLVGGGARPFGGRGSALFDAWFAGLTDGGTKNGCLTPIAPSRLHATHLRTHLIDRLLATVGRCDGRVSRFRVETV